MDVAVTGTNERTVVSASERGSSQALMVFRALVSGNLPLNGASVLSYLM